MDQLIGLRQLSSPLQNFFFDTIRALNRENIRYVVHGAAACYFYGLIRPTRDLDFGIDGFVQFTQAVKVVRRMGLPTLNFKKDFLDFTPEQAAIMERSPVFYELLHSDESAELTLWDNDLNIGVDLFLIKKGYGLNYFDRALAISGIQIASMEDLLIGKVVRGKSKDFEDIRMMIEANPEACDLPYIESWLLKFGEKKGKDFWGIFRRLFCEEEGTVSRNPEKGLQDAPGQEINEG